MLLNNLMTNFIVKRSSRFPAFYESMITINNAIIPKNYLKNYKLRVIHEYGLSMRLWVFNIIFYIVGGKNNKNASFNSLTCDFANLVKPRRSLIIFEFPIFSMIYNCNWIPNIRVFQKSVRFLYSFSFLKWTKLIIC